VSRETLNAIDELSERLSRALPANGADYYAIAYAIAVYVDKALEIGKSKPRDPDDVDMGQ
jgi:hypothetical protein